MGKLFTPQPIASGFNTNNSLNQNFSNLEAALDKCLSRDGETPNAMGVELDMNSHNIINVGTLYADAILLDNKEIPSVESLQGFLADAINTIDGKIDDADNLLDGKISDADILLGGKVSAAEGFSIAAGISAGNATTAQGLAEDAQQAAEDAVASINMPTIAPGDADKLLSVKTDETGYKLIAPPVIPEEKVPLGGTVTVTVTSGGTYPTVKSAIDYGRAKYIPGTGSFVINLDKETLGNDDVISAYTGENLSWMTVSLVRASYTYAGTISYFISGSTGGTLPVIYISPATVSISKGRISLGVGSFLSITAPAGRTLALDGLTDSSLSCIYLQGGELSVTGGASVSAKSVPAALRMVKGGRAFFENTLTLETSNTLGLASTLEEGSVFHANATNITVVDFGPAVQVKSGASAYMKNLSVSGITGPTSVSATEANVINLKGSAATCSLTDNTLSTDGILIR